MAKGSVGGSARGASAGGGPDRLARRTVGTITAFDPGATTAQEGAGGRQTITLRSANGRASVTLDRNAATSAIAAATARSERVVVTQPGGPGQARRAVSIAPSAYPSMRAALRTGFTDLRAGRQALNARTAGRRLGRQVARQR